MESAEGLEYSDKLLLTGSLTCLGRRKHMVLGTELINKQNPLTRPQSWVLCYSPHWGQC